MAFGGLLEVLDVPVPVDDGFGGTFQMTHRAFIVQVGICVNGFSDAPQPTADPIVCTVRVFIGKVVGNDFRPSRAAGAKEAAFTQTELKAMPTVSIASLIAAAKQKLGLT